MKKTFVLVLMASILSFFVVHAPGQIFARNEFVFYKTIVPKKAPTYPKLKEFLQMQKEWIKIETTMGAIIIELNPQAAPKTCVNFRSLIKAGFYDGVIFHRVIEDFMIQAGGYTSDTTLKLKYSFEDEINPLGLGLEVDDIIDNERSGYRYDFNLPSMKHLQGVISMANAGPKTNGSQFFIMSREEEAYWLNGKHTVFGHVVKGMDIVLAIEKVATDETDKPLEDVTILSIQIIEKPGE